MKINDDWSHYRKWEAKNMKKKLEQNNAQFEKRRDISYELNFNRKTLGAFAPFGNVIKWLSMSIVHAKENTRKKYSVSVNP